ncbi:uncharacterized protein LOC143585263 [Bidens hawaiensis]|uniref:uncharacterized protein LOC143585263 n=1 Tax=Bidens hawaiensis TaxID=980011 RepID=UPI00404A99E3
MTDPKTDAASSSSVSNSKATALHTAYSVTNINSKIRTLDGSTLTYSQWTKLFTLHAIAYKVLDHIDGTEPPADDNPDQGSWKEIDALVLQWIYSTLSKEYLDRVLELQTTARDVWLKLENIFLNNKSARARTLNQKLSNLTLNSCSSLADYCQKLKEIASQLGNVGQPVLEPRLVTQLVQGLPPEYAVSGALIHQLAPTWDNACTMLHHEEMRIKNQTHVGNSSTVLAATKESPDARGKSFSTQNWGGRGYQGRDGRRGRGQRGRGGRKFSTI